MEFVLLSCPVLYSGYYVDPYVPGHCDLTVWMLQWQSTRIKEVWSNPTIFTLQAPLIWLIVLYAFLAILRWMYVANSNYLIIWQSTVHRSYMWYKPIMFYFIPQHANFFFSLSLSHHKKLKLLDYSIFSPMLLWEKWVFIAKKILNIFKKNLKDWRNYDVIQKYTISQFHHKDTIRWLFDFFFIVFIS